jgi:WD40 repeat protein
VYESATLKLLADYTENCSAVAFSPDGKRVAMRTTDAIRVFDIDSEKLVTDEEFKESLLSTRAFSFGPDGKTLLAQPFQGLLKFDAFGPPLKNVYIQSEGFVRSPDGKQLAAIRTKKDRVDVIDATTGKETATFEMKHPTAIAWSPDGKWIATANGLTLHVWSATTGKARLRKVGHDDDILAIAFTPDGKSVVTGGKDNLVYVWDLPPVP